MKTAKVFKSGNSQAVRIPKELHIDDEEVEIRRKGRAIVLEPRKRSWTSLFESLGKFTDDFMAEGRNQPRSRSARRSVMKMMLDTNICVDIIRQRPQPVLERFKTYDVGDIGISMVTLAELEYAVSASRRPAKNREALDQFVWPLEIVAFDRPATAAGRLRATLEKKGQMIGSMDLLIAAHAVSLDVRLVTHKAREFPRVPGLKIEDWQ